METDYINRADVLALKQTPGAYGMDISSEEVKAIPAADVRPVVYCRECEHSQDGFICDSPFHGGMTFPDDFCSRGIRREGGADG